MNTEPVLIRDTGSLAAILKGVKPRRIRLELPDLDQAEARQEEGRINALLGACGCGEGRLLLGLTVAGYLLKIWLHPAAGSSTLIWGLLWALAGALLGKWLGLWRARIQLKRRVFSLLAKSQVAAAPEIA